MSLTYVSSVIRAMYFLKVHYFKKYWRKSLEQLPLAHHNFDHHFSIA